jgi:hypothetical protein
MTSLPGPRSYTSALTGFASVRGPLKHQQQKRDISNELTTEDISNEF